MSRAGRADPVTADPSGRFADADYAGAFRITIDHPGTRSAEQWVRAVFEDAPRPMRWFVRIGWQGVLGLRLGPRGSPEHVLGWLIRGKADGSIHLQVESALLTAHKVLVCEDSRIVMATFIYFKLRSARLLWSLVSPVHHRTEPYLLTRAAAESEPQRS